VSRRALEPGENQSGIAVARADRHLPFELLLAPGSEHRYRAVIEIDGAPPVVGLRVAKRDRVDRRHLSETGSVAHAGCATKHVADEEAWRRRLPELRARAATLNDDPILRRMYDEHRPDDERIPPPIARSRLCRGPHRRMHRFPTAAKRYIRLVEGEYP
jgi:hypothetical protein